MLWLWPALTYQPPRPTQGQFELLAADVGQGSAVVVRTARHSLLYDAGPRYSLDSDAGERVLVPLLRALGTAGFVCLLAGGLLYTGGIVFFALDQRVRHFHGVWHLFVLAGSALHYAAVWWYVLPAPAVHGG